MMQNRCAADPLVEGPPLRQVAKNLIEADGQRLLYFAGCDYFRFASHPLILRAIDQALRPGGLNVAASRFTTGNNPLYREAETRIAEFFEVADALLLPTGYVTNLVVTQALAAEVTHAFADERAHVCVTDAARFLNCLLTHFPHRDATALARRLRRLPASARPLVLTDGLFSGNGAVAPLADYLAALPARGWLLVDDAHGAGTLGAQGQGSPEHGGVRDERLIQTLTFSKAFGVYGGAVLCPPGLRALLATGSHLFAGSTPLPLPLVAGVLAALAAMRAQGPTRRRRLQSHAAWLRGELRAAGQPAEDQPGPIFPVHLASEAARESLCRRLLQAGIYPSFIRYPGGPEAGYFRFVLSSEHTRANVAALAAVLMAAPSA
jgi:7-keto-8-aminopelargonate synthetase-like enzyme